MSLKIVSDPEQLITIAAESVVHLAAAAIAETGRFTIALAGGSTPKPIYERLATEEFAKRVDWARVQIFWGDERCVPPDHPQSNYHMTREALLDHVPIPALNVHRIRGEQNPREAAEAYGRELQAVFGGDAEKGGPPAEGFDLILLGMGDNGHTASLFPGLPAVLEQCKWVMAQYVEVVAAWRITLTPVIINAARNVTFLVSGTGKAERLHEVIEGPYQPEVLPAQVIKPKNGRLTWLVDRSAAAQLKNAEQR
jgi:6-phosphogluconolactonase